VRTDLAAIPQENTDQNYVDKWLEMQMEEYKKKQGIDAATRMRKALEAGLKRWVGNNAVQYEH
jgi:phage regulator Rha-like protein